MSSWWQTRLLPYCLRYLLTKTGILEERALDTTTFNVSIGRQNVIELKDVGIDIARLSGLAQLPPSLRIESARIALLRLTIPADFYQSSILVEVEGVHLNVRLVDDLPTQRDAGEKSGSRSPTTSRAPPHRKTEYRRFQSTQRYELNSTSNDEEDPHIPSTQEVVKSFLLDASPREQQNLDASIAGEIVNLEESYTSQGSDADDVGTGVSVGVPGFLSSFLQGLIDRLRVDIVGIQVRLDLDSRILASARSPIAVQFIVGRVNVGAAESPQTDQRGESTRNRIVKVHETSIELLQDENVYQSFSEPKSSAPSQSSESESRDSIARSNTLNDSTDGSVSQTQRTSIHGETNESSPGRGSENSQNDAAGSRNQYPYAASSSSHHSSQALSHSVNSLKSQVEPLHASISTVDADRFADAGSEDARSGTRAAASELDIRLGDDNMSWGSRRSQTSAPANDLWRSMVSEDDPLQESMQSMRINSPQMQSSTLPPIPKYQQSKMLLNTDRHASSIDSQVEHSLYHDLPDRNQTDSSPESPGPLDEPDLLKHSHTTEDDEDDAQDNDNDQFYDNDDDLMRSQLFDHETARSMYMSAISSNSLPHVPGGWLAESETSKSHADNDSKLQQASITMSLEDPQTPSGNVTPRAESPLLNFAPKPSLMRAIRLLHIATVSLTVVQPRGSVEGGSPDPVSSSMARSTTLDMPGKFSMYSSEISSRLHRSVVKERPSMQQETCTATPANAALDIAVHVDNVNVQFEMNSIRMVQSLTSSLSGLSSSAQSSSLKKIPADASKTSARFSLDLEVLDLCLVPELSRKDRIEQQQKPPGELALSCTKIVFKHAEETRLNLSKVAFTVEGTELLSVKPEHGARSALLLALDTSKISAGGHRITSANLDLGVVKIVLQPSVIDGSLAALGGISTLAELGSSFLTDSDHKSPSPRAARGVRFAREVEPQAPDAELKVNARIYQAGVIIQSRNSSINLSASSLRAIYRDQKVAMTVDHVQLSGPQSILQPQPIPPVSVVLSIIRLEYCPTPPEKDLERLLSLLTPSKDKYDGDDDILVDTLLRQRRKGALARIGVKQISVRVERHDFIDDLTSFTDEISKLSAVTKYLPEDDRPGLLTLVRVGDVNVEAPINAAFGSARLDLSNINIAHVGLPALLALSVGVVHATQINGANLIHPLVNYDNSDDTPMVMARMLGGEETPTIKIKLFNLGIEYSATVIAALTESESTDAVTVIANDVQASIADIAASVAALPGISPTAVNTTDSSASKMIVDVLMHESAIGLNPLELSSKAYLVLWDVQLTVMTLPKSMPATKLDVRKVEMLITDEAELSSGAQTNVPQIALAGSKNRLLNKLHDQGYVSIASIRSATIAVKSNIEATESSPTIEVDVQNELLLLETCADSTQTMIALFGALAPPSKPSLEPKYLTEPMTIEDMMASFTGEPESNSDDPPETLFDAGEVYEDESEAGFDMEASMEIDADLFAESEMTSSLYGPVSGVFGQAEDAPPEDDSYAEAAESLLEDDPFEMPLSPTDENLGDNALIRELKKQCKTAFSGPKDLSVHEAEPSDQIAQALYYENTGSEASKPVLVLRLRKCHIIWHLYDGYDWERTRQGIVEVVEEVERKAEERKARRRQSHNDRDDEESVIGDILFNSIYIGVPADGDAADLRRRINHHIDDQMSETESVPVSGISRPSHYSGATGIARVRPRRRLKLGRSRSHKISFELKDVAADVIVFPSSNQIVNAVDLRIRDFEIYDNVPQSTWRKFLTGLHNDPRTRELAKPMFHIHLETVKTLAHHAATELAIEVSVLPLRLHVDQDALDFIQRFFGFKDNKAQATPEKVNDQPFIQRLEVHTVDLCLDYKPKHLDYAGLRAGRTNELMNLITLDAANIRLNHAIVYGLRGFDVIHPTLNDIWTPDVKRNQLPTVLAGLAPLRSLANLGAGLRDVVAVPVREYRKDGRLFRSIQKGTFQFGKTTASELARLGAKVALGTQTALANAEGLLSPETAARPSASRRVSSEQRWHDMASVDDDDNHRAISAYADQPLGVLSGLRSARRQLEHDLLTARDALIAVQGEILESRDAAGAAAAIARHAPTVILRPVIGATRAVGTTLLGVGNQVDRSNVRRVDDKYKHR